MLKDKTLTYISLFSSAGVGCYGFKEAGFECIATNELVKRRINIQKINNKCKYESGYICDDITAANTKNKINAEIEKWRKLGNDKVDVLIATPPCQGMSVANHKKTENEIIRNSLVVESINMIKDINPRFFIFENVAAFMKTGCSASNGEVKAIGDVIYDELGADYVIMDRILNFKNYGSNSSRTRTLVIGVNKTLGEFVAPIEFYPDYVSEKTLSSVIGDMPKLEWGEICKNDFYHAFRTYPEHMREWIRDLKEGESAFENTDENKRPHKVIDGKIVPNINKNGDKYTRQYWDKVAPCIHTRNDQLASQNTIHPTEDRVFSIRELMKLMTIPDSFRWIDKDLDELNNMTEKSKSALLKKEEINIRQSIGEAVPTEIFFQIAKKIKAFMGQEHLSNVLVKQTIKKYELDSPDKLIKFIEENPLNLCLATLSRIAEMANSKRESNSAYYTNKYIINEIYKQLPSFDREELFIMEPSVGVGSFLPFIMKRYENVRKVNIDVVDIDEANIRILKILMSKQAMPENVRINYICDDTLLHNFDKNYDLVIGNPPFTKLKARDAKKYLKENLNKDTKNTFEFFLEKALRIAENVVMIMPKALLNTPEFNATREMLSHMNVKCIQDLGENGFKGVLVETVCLHINTRNVPKKTNVISLTNRTSHLQEQGYIMDKQYPYWIIYRNEFFDRVAKKLEFDKFTVFRDRQITNSNTRQKKNEGALRVIKSRNISDDGKKIMDIPGYDAYIDENAAQTLNAYKFVGDDSVYLTPNMTYKPRVTRNTGRALVNGSVAVLIPKEKFKMSEKQMEYFSTDEYRKFYQIARNFQTRSLNVDAASVFFFGILKEQANG